MGHFIEPSLSAESFPLLEQTTTFIMLSLSLITLVTLAASPFLGLLEVNAFKGKDAPSPELWLANLRSETGATPHYRTSRAFAVLGLAQVSDFACSWWPNCPWA
jgi:hypothetical protein